MADVKTEANRLLGLGKTLAQVRIELEGKGFSTEDIAEVLNTSVDTRTLEERRNSCWLAVRDVFDRIGYGGAPPQFVNILLWLSQSTNPYILPIIGALNGVKSLFAVVWSGVMHEYAKLHRVEKNTIAAAGIIYGFSFLFMSFGLLLGGTAGLALFSLSFLVGIFGSVAYGDLYNEFVDDTIRRERWGGFLRSIAHWGVLITAAVLLLAGFLLDVFPIDGTSWTMNFFGVHNLKVYGFLVAFEVTAFAFIISGYVSSLVTDRRAQREYPFFTFLGEYYHLMRSKLHIFADRYVFLLGAAAVISGFLQILITAYSGIAMYQLFAKQTATPFFTLAAIYAIAILASFTGPWFTKRVHRMIGLAPTLVFGTMLVAILPLVLWLTPSDSPNVAAITAALCLYVIGGAISGFAQGALAQRLMNEDTRRAYFQAQSFIIILPYLILIPVFALSAYWLSLGTLFLIVAIALLVVVMPIYFVLVLASQKLRL